MVGSPRVGPGAAPCLSCDQLAASPATVAGTPSIAPTGDSSPSLADRPAEQLLGVRIDRIEMAAVAGDRLVADALLAQPRRRCDGVPQLRPPPWAIS